MRVCCLVMTLLFCLCVPVAAVAPVNAGLIDEAQNYGRTNAGKSLAEFLQPWTVYEERSEKLDETAERAYVYTPFLLLAADARDKALNAQGINRADAEKILTDYNGYVIFGVVVSGSEPNFSDKLAAVVKQDKKTVKEYTGTRPPKAEKAPWSPETPPVYVCHAYIYFKSKDIATDKPLVLQINSGRQERRFSFDLTQYK
ncbi:MAG: hypothetical protein P4N41_22235 [Negativicutes bacterium]|nr:hypothetical protein [Negativicutes bacterium]